MQLGIFDPVFGKVNAEEMLRQLKRYPQITAVELGTGGWPGSTHVEVDALLASREHAKEFAMRFADAGLSIAALSCHNNPVHPNDEVARDADAVFLKTVALAERLSVATVVTFSGCPGGGPGDTTPNWITTPWPPENLDALSWQWEEKLVPYWRDAARFVEEHGVRVALEAHPGFCVYNTHTLLRLREATSKAIGINLDPSHLWWQQMEIPTVIATLGDAIHHVHAKDVALLPERVARDGVVDNRSYAEMGKRSWMFRSVGWGHSELEWKAIVSALRMVGYDGVLSIEHEDALASLDEGLGSAVAFLERVLLREKPVDAWWV